MNKKFSDCISGNVGIVDYKFNSAIQTFGVFLVALNSCANPLVYCVIMRSFRARMTSVLCCCPHLCQNEHINNGVYATAEVGEEQHAYISGTEACRTSCYNPKSTASRDSRRIGVTFPYRFGQHRHTCLCNCLFRTATKSIPKSKHKQCEFYSTTVYKT